MQGKECASSEEITAYSHNVSAGFFSFEVSDFGGKRAFGLASVRENKEWKILVVISADDVLSVQAHVLTDMANLGNLIRAIEPLRSQLPNKRRAPTCDSRPARAQGPSVRVQLDFLIAGTDQQIHPLPS
jgi:hypothetical protein